MTRLAIGVDPVRTLPFFVQVGARFRDVAVVRLRLLGELFGMSSFGVGFGLCRTASGGDLLRPRFSLSDLEFLFRRPIADFRRIDPPVFTPATHQSHNDGSKHYDDYDCDDDSHDYTGGAHSDTPRIPRVVLTQSEYPRLERQTMLGPTS